MNISQAKEYIKDSVRVYLKKDEYGSYRIPLEKQRPIFLLGAPGVGKTAIMEQVAQELGIALVSYSMTHHTRQSALGLPFIAHKEYEGMQYDVSEYTMSEIIASVYEVMEQSEIREGILFLDEINCVSETLAPSMLQFLQYKVFGRHRVPDGWVIVTAGNPPEYNRSVREFDVVTLDRMKILEVDPDYEAFKAYAAKRKIHGAVIGYLDLNRKDFYSIESTAKGKNYVTTRGWEDLSRVLVLYEEEGLKVDESLVGQYLRNARIVREFTAYYDLYCKYKKDYHVAEILAAGGDDNAVKKAAAAPFDERLSLIGLLIEGLLGELEDTMKLSRTLSSLAVSLRAVKTDPKERPVTELLQIQSEARKASMEKMQKAGALSERDRTTGLGMVRFYGEVLDLIRTSQAVERSEEFGIVKQHFDKQKELLRSRVEVGKRQMENVLSFTQRAFGEENELTLVLTELTVHEDSTEFIASFGSEAFQNYSSKMMLTGRKEQLLDQIRALDL